MKIHKRTSIVIMFIAVMTGAAAFSNGQSVGVCDQSRAEQELLLTETTRKPYVLHRIEIAGNIFVKDREIRNRSRLRVGDIFDRSSVMKAPTRISKIHELYPFSLNDVKIILDRSRTDVDLIFCVKERPRKTI